MADITNPALGLINNSVRNQIEASRALLDQAKKLQEILANISDREVREQLYSINQSLIKIARELSTDAMTTTSTTSTTITSSSIVNPFVSVFVPPKKSG